MNCRSVRRFVGDPEVSLSAAERAELDAHLRGCVGCGSLQRREALVSQWLQDLPAAEPSANFEWRLRLRLSQLEHPSAPSEPATALRAGSRRWVLPFALSSAAAAIAVLAVGLGLEMRHPAAPGNRASQSVTAEVDPSPWTPRPHGSAGLGWPRLVPVRAGAPLGPEVRADAAPSILGSAPADTSQRQLRREPIEVQPVGW